MKVASKRLLSLCFIMMYGFTVIAQVPPPPPGEEEPVVPIDENIFVLFFMAILFGIYITYKYNSKQKTSV